MTRLIRIFLGVLLIVIGIVSFFLPFSPGLLFLFAGLVLLGSKRAKAAFMKAHKKASILFGPKAGRLLLIPLAHLEDKPEKKISDNPLKGTNKTYNREKISKPPEKSLQTPFSSDKKAL